LFVNGILDVKQRVKVVIGFIWLGIWNMIINVVGA
jgi:hypothetical protein